MFICIETLIEKYKHYIINDKIINYYDFNFDIITNNIDKFKLFLDEYKEYKNNTYLYFKCVYHYCKNELTIILNLTEGIVESNIYNLIGCYYQYIEKDYDLMKKYYLMAIELNNSFAINNFK